MKRIKIRQNKLHLERTDHTPLLSETFQFGPTQMDFAPESNEFRKSKPHTRRRNISESVTLIADRTRIISMDNQDVNEHNLTIIVESSDITDLIIENFKELMKVCMELEDKSGCFQTVFDADYFW